MKIQYASDLHLEFSENASYIKHNPLNPVGDILVLAGDIGYLGDQNYVNHPFLDWASNNFDQVIVSMGNHEFYKFFDLSTLHDGYKQVIRHNVVAYYNDVVTVGDADIIVSTLWSKINLDEAYYAERGVSDFHRILYDGDLLTFSDFNREHKRCIDFIKKAVADSVGKHKIVVTHHVPSFKMLCQKYKGSKINGAFIVELKDYIENSGIDYWIYGHSHYNIDVRIGNTWCISNQLGYVFQNEHESFKRDAVIELP